jgi:hypothetical protein
MNFVRKLLPPSTESAANDIFDVSAEGDYPAVCATLDL